MSQEGDAPQGDLDVSFKGLHSAQLASLKLYDFAGGVKGDRDLLANVTPEADGYKLMMNTKLPAGDYLVEGYNAEGQCNGSLVLTVKANQDNVFTLNRAYEIYATNDSYSWVEGTDYSIEYNGFFGCRHFSKANAFLKSHGIEEIDWSID